MTYYWAAVGWQVTGLLFCLYGLWHREVPWGGAGGMLCGVSGIAWVSGARPVAVVNLALGAWSVWSWWRRGGGRQKVARVLGEKSAALRAALVRRAGSSRVPRRDLPQALTAGLGSWGAAPDAREGPCGVMAGQAHPLSGLSRRPGPWA